MPEDGGSFARIQATNASPFMRTYPKTGFPAIARPVTSQSCSKLPSAFKKPTFIEQNPLYQTSGNLSRANKSQASLSDSMASSQDFTRQYVGVYQGIVAQQNLSRLRSNHFFADTSLGSLKNRLARAELSRTVSIQRDMKRRERREQMEEIRERKLAFRRQERERRRQLSQKRSNAARVIQRSYRDYLDRDKLRRETERLNNQCATTVENWYRQNMLMFHAKLELQRRQMDVLQRGAVRQIERCYYFYTLRKAAKQELNRRRAERELQRFALIIEVQAANATQIQALWRGVVGRRNAKSELERRNQERLIQLQEAQMRQRIESDLRRKEKERERVAEERRKRDDKAREKRERLERIPKGSSKGRKAK